MAQLKHRLAIVKVVARKELIEPAEVLSQVLQLRLVKLLEEGRDGIRREHRRQTWQHSRQLRVHFGEFLDGLVRRGNARAQLQVEDITLRIGPFVGGGAAGDRIHRGVDGDAAEKTRGLEPARDHRRLRRLGRGRRFFGNHDLDRFVRRGGLRPVPSLERNPAQDDRRQRGQEQKEREPAQRPQTKSGHASGYFLIQATIATMTPITLRTDINPAGMACPVFMNAGTNRPGQRDRDKHRRARDPPPDCWEAKRPRPAGEFQKSSRR